MRTIAASVLVIACLSACSEKAPDAAAGSSSANDASMVDAGASPAAMKKAIEEFGPAPGKWRLTMTTMGQTMPATETCYAKTNFAEMQTMQADAGITCTENSYRREGADVVGHSVCTTKDGMKMTTDSRISGDLGSAYTMDMTSKLDPPPMPSLAEQKISITAERIGDCAPGQ